MKIFVYPQSHRQYSMNVGSQFHAANLVDSYIHNNKYEFIKCYGTITNQADHTEVDKVILDIFREAVLAGNMHQPVPVIYTKEVPSTGDLIIYAHGNTRFGLVIVK